MFNVAFVGRDPILCPFYGFWLKPKAEHFSGEDSPWKASREKCGEKLASLSLPISLTACSSFPQTDNTHNLPKEAGLQIDQSQNCVTVVLLPLLLLLPSLSPAPTHFCVTFYCTTALLPLEQDIEKKNLFKTMERRIKRK